MAPSRERPRPPGAARAGPISPRRLRPWRLRPPAAARFLVRFPPLPGHWLRAAPHRPALDPGMARLRRGAVGGGGVGGASCSHSSLTPPLPPPARRSLSAGPLPAVPSRSGRVAACEPCCGRGGAGLGRGLLPGWGCHGAGVAWAGCARGAVLRSPPRWQLRLQRRLRPLARRLPVPVVPLPPAGRSAATCAAWGALNAALNFVSPRYVHYLYQRSALGFLPGCVLHAFCISVSRILQLVCRG